MTELIITDITSLGAGKVCIGGRIGDRSARLAPPNPTDTWVASMGGLLPGSVIDVRWTRRSMIERPHVEDGDWESLRVKPLRRMTEEELVELLMDDSFGSVRAAFG